MQINELKVTVGEVCEGYFDDEKKVLSVMTNALI